MKYEVIVTRDTTESAVIEVEAESKEAAAANAINIANSEAVGWEIDEGNSPQPYLAAGVEDDVTNLDDGEQSVIR